MMLRMSPEQVALSRAQLAVKKGIATAEQVAIVEAAKAKKKAAEQVAKKAAKAAKKAREEWAKNFKVNHADEIERINEHNAFFCNYDKKVGEYYGVKNGNRYNG